MSYFIFLIKLESLSFEISNILFDIFRRSCIFTDAFEKAARMGMNDIKAFVRGNKHFHEANSNPSPSKYESTATSSSIVNEEQPSTSTQHSKQDQGMYDGYTEIQKSSTSTIFTIGMIWGRSCGRVMIVMGIVIMGYSINQNL